jgi:tetratricopeptide (TPR) repeat protein
LETGGRLLNLAFDLARRHRQPEVELMALHGRGYILFREGRWNEALRVVQSGLRLAGKLRRSDFQRILKVLEAGVLFDGLHRIEEARQLYQEVLDDAREAGAKPHMVSGLMGLSRVERDSGNLDEALRILQQAVSIAEATQDRSIIPTTYAAMAYLLRCMGRMEEARTLSRRAVTLNREVGPSPTSFQVFEAWETLRSPIPRPTRSALAPNGVKTPLVHRPASQDH